MVSYLTTPFLGKQWKTSRGKFFPCKNVPDARVDRGFAHDADLLRTKLLCPVLLCLVTLKPRTLGREVPGLSHSRVTIRCDLE